MRLLVRASCQWGTFPHLAFPSPAPQLPRLPRRDPRPRRRAPAAPRGHFQLRRGRGHRGASLQGEARVRCERHAPPLGPPTKAAPGQAPCFSCPKHCKINVPFSGPPSRTPTSPQPLAPTALPHLPDARRGPQPPLPPLRQGPRRPPCAAPPSPCCGAALDSLATETVAPATGAAPAGLGRADSGQEGEWLGANPGPRAPVPSRRKQFSPHRSPAPQWQALF